MDFVHFFDYLVLARRRLFDWIQKHPPAVYTRLFPIGLGSIRATLIHVAAAEWGYVQRLAGRDYGPEDVPFTVARYPDFEPFAAAWDQQRPLTREALASLGDSERVLEYVSRTATPPVRVRATAGGLAGQLLFHEIHHRSQVMAMLRQAGIPAENLDYSILMVERTPL